MSCSKYFLTESFSLCRYLDIRQNNLCSRECKAEASMVDSCYFDLFALIKGIGKKNKSSFPDKFVLVFDSQICVISTLPPFLSWGRFQSEALDPGPTNKHCHCRWKCKFATWQDYVFFLGGDFHLFRCGEYAMKIWCDLMNNEYVLEYGDKVR